MIRPRLLPLAFLAFLIATPAASADRIVTMDGRQVVAKKARKEGEGYRLEFEYGTIELKDGAQVKAVEIEGDMSDYVPKDDNEREKLEKGFVRYQGKWMSKRAYETELHKEGDRRREEADAALAYADWQNALETESKYFNIRTNTSPELMEYYADLLDAYYKMMKKELGIVPTPSMRGVKLWVNIYKSREEFTKKTQMSPGVAGFFRPNLDRSNLNFYHDYPEPSTSQWVGLHECTHLLTYLLDQEFRPQIWINEAVADYFGSSTIVEKKGKITITPGKLQTDRVLTVQQAIRDDNAIGLEQLFMIDRADFQAFEYAHAWSFVYFLNNGAKGKYKKGFASFFKDLYSLKGIEYSNESGYGASGKAKVVTPEAIRAMLLKKIKVKDVKSLEAAWHDYIAGISVDAPEARLKRGLRFVMMWEFEDALPDLTAAIDAGILDPRAFAARARAYSFNGNESKAAADMAKAIELDPLNAQYRHDQSNYMIGLNPRIFFKDVSDWVSDDANLGAARDQAGLAMELDPENREFERWFGVLNVAAKGSEAKE